MRRPLGHRAVRGAKWALSLAELDGRPVAAMDMADGSVVDRAQGTDPAAVLVLHLHRLAARLVGRIWGA